MAREEREPALERQSGCLFTTDSQPVDSRRSYWREALSRTFGAVHMAVPDEVFSGTIRTVPLGRLQAVTVEGDRLSAVRTRRLVEQGSEDVFVVVKLMDRGTARLEQDGREVDLAPGDIFLYDMARPLRLAFPHPFRTKSLVLPRSVLGLSEAEMVQVTASPIRRDTPLGGLLSPFLAGLVDGAGAYPPRTSELMARNVVELLGTLADEKLGRSEEAPGANSAMLLRIQEYIDQHLANPDLNPAAIAQAHHISLRYLHKLFEGEDATVGRWIQRRRLEKCRRDLVRRANLTTIAAIAHQWGFTSAAHFSRVFRATYGMTPREWREAELAGR